MVIKGDYPPHKGNVLLKRATIILGVSFFERLAYFSGSGSLTVFFARELSMDAVLAQQMQAVFASLVYLVPIFGSFVADTWTGRYLITLIGIIIGFIGMVLVTTGSSLQTAWLSCFGLFVPYAVATAMVVPNILVLGGDQFDEREPLQMRQRDVYWGAFYWNQNVAAAIAFIVMNQVAVEGLGWVQTSFSFTFVFACASIFLALSLIILLGGSKFIFASKPQGSPLMKFLSVTGKAITKPKTLQGVWVIIGMVALVFAVIASIPSFFVDQPWLDYTIAAIIVVACILLVVFGRTSEWIQHAETVAPGRYPAYFINGAKDVYRLAPYVAFMIPFRSVYNQIYTGFVTQGCQANNNIGGIGISPSVMPGIDSLFIIVVVPLLEKWIYPGLGKVCGGKFAASPLRRIAAGFVAAGLGMLNGALYEYYRRDAPLVMTLCDEEKVDLGWCTFDQIGTSVPELSSCFDYVGDNPSPPVPKNDLHLMWQTPQYILVGAAEVLTCITYYNFFYAQVPPFMRSVCQSIQMLTISLGTMVSAVINALCKEWLPNNLNDGNQEYMYYVNAGFTFTLGAALIVVAMSFEYKPGTSLMPGDEATGEDLWGVADGPPAAVSESCSSSDTDIDSIQAQKEPEVVN